MESLFLTWEEAVVPLSAFLDAQSAVKLSYVSWFLSQVFHRGRPAIWLRYLVEPGYRCRPYLENTGELYRAGCHPNNYRLVVAALVEAGWLQRAMKVRKMLDAGRLKEELPLLSLSKITLRLASKPTKTQPPAPQLKRPLQQPAASGKAAAGKPNKPQEGLSISQAFSLLAQKQKRQRQLAGELPILPQAQAASAGASQASHAPGRTDSTFKRFVQRAVASGNVSVLVAQLQKQRDTPSAHSSSSSRKENTTSASNSGNDPNSALLATALFAALDDSVPALTAGRVVQALLKAAGCTGRLAEDPLLGGLVDGGGRPFLEALRQQPAKFDAVMRPL